MNDSKQPTADQPANLPLTGAAALPQKTTVKLWEYEIPVYGDKFTMGEMALAFEAAQGGRSIQDMSFIMEFLAEAITNRCGLEMPVTAYDLRKKWINPTELMDVFQQLYAPFLAKVEESKAEGKTETP